MKIKKIIFIVILINFLAGISQLNIIETSIASNLSIVPNQSANNISSPSLYSSSENSISLEFKPEVFADSAILLDIRENKILYEKNSASKMYPASTTKLLTAILAFENCKDLAQKANVSYYAVNTVPYSYATASLVPGEQVTIKDLLYALLVPSANDAAYVLAQFIASSGNNYSLDNSELAFQDFNNSISAFSDMLNSKAKEIGCIGTHFVNPNGIHNEQHYSTAYDLMLIGKYAYQIPALRSICQTTEYTLPNTNMYVSTPRKLETTNLLIKPNQSRYYMYANGLKTGYTDPAQSCIISSASKDGRDLIAVILHSSETDDESKSRESDCKRLFEYGFNYFSYSTLCGENSIVQSLNIFNGNQETKQLNVLCANEIKTFIIRGQVIDATPQITINKNFAPISKGEVIGKISYTINGESLSSDLIAEHDVYPVSYLLFVVVIGIIFLVFLVGLLVKNKKRKLQIRKKK